MLRALGKSMVNLRVENIVHEDLGKKFDLKMLRAFFFSFTEHLKEASGIPSYSLNQNLSEEENHTYMGSVRDDGGQQKHRATLRRGGKVHGVKVDDATERKKDHRTRLRGRI
ncbi:hypothetical protein ACS0TY_013786 [Phlomoides rotata]